MSISLDALDHDTLIYIFTALSVPEILLLRQVSRRLYLISQEYTVWRAACTWEILQDGIPFPGHSLISLSARDLERQTLRAYKLGLNWRSPSTRLHFVAYSDQRCGGVEEIKFLSRGGRTWVVTAGICIWWNLTLRDYDSLRVVSQWSAGKALFDGIVINTDDNSEAMIAVSVHSSSSTVEILSISEDESGDVMIQPHKTLNSSRKPIALDGDIIVLCDHDSETLILNWKTQEQALLKSPNTWQDKPLRVTFAYGSVFVVRARSVCIFDQPRMVYPGEDLEVVSPSFCTSFGWVNAVSLALRPPTPFLPASSSQSPFTILVRNKGADPWNPKEQFQLMTLNSDFGSSLLDGSRNSAYLSLTPFAQVSSLSSSHQYPSRSSDTVLGSYGSAVWVQPTDWAESGLVVDSSLLQATSMPIRETLIVALFPGLLKQGSGEAQVKVVLENSGNDWSCLDYDEARGLIALGTGYGEVTVYRL